MLGGLVGDKNESDLPGLTDDIFEDGTLDERHRHGSDRSRNIDTWQSEVRA